MKEQKHFHRCAMSGRAPHCNAKSPADAEATVKCDGIFDDETNCCNTLGLCNAFECKVLAQLDAYKDKLEEANADKAKLKAWNTQFRNLLLMPTMVERMLADDELNENNIVKSEEINLHGISSIIAKQRPSWDQCDVNTILYMMEYHQKFLEAYTQYCHDRSDKIQIPRDRKIKKDSENKKATEYIEKEEQQQKLKKPKSEYEKAVAMFYGNFIRSGMDKELALTQAKAMVDNMLVSKPKDPSSNP